MVHPHDSFWPVVGRLAVDRPRPGIVPESEDRPLIQTQTGVGARRRSLIPRQFLLIVTMISSFVLGGDQVESQSDSSDERAELLELLETGQYQQVEEWYLEEPNRFPLLWARFLNETGKPKEALELIVSSERFGAEDPTFLVMAGALEQERGQLKRAKALLRKAIRSDERAVEARTRLGQIFEREGEREDAKSQWNSVLEIYRQMTAAEARRTSPEDFVWMGKACAGLQRIHEAYEVLYSSAFDVQKDSVAAHVASGWLLYAKYNYPDARSHFKDALKKNPNHAEAHVGLARAIYADYSYSGRWRDTRLHLEQARQVNPNHPKARMLEGDIFFYDEEWGKAAACYQSAISADPTDLWRVGRLAALYYATAQLEKFEALRKKVEEESPLPAAFYGSLAERLVDRFFYVEATDFAKRAVEIDPDYWPAYVTLGVNALRSGREELGREYAEKAFETDRFNLWALNTLQLIKRIDRMFVEERDEDFVIRMPESEAPFLMPYLKPLLRETRDRMERQYQQRVTRPITVEDFSQHMYFSARSIGLPGLAASGVCFGRMVTLTTPRAIPGNWGAVAVHELAHVVTLHKAAHRIPRWFGEGLSVFEEGRGHRRWSRSYAEEWVDAVHANLLLGMADIQKGFTRPSFPGQILLSYYQGGAICDFIERDWSYDHLLQMLQAYRKGMNTEDVFQEVLGVSLAAFDKRFMAYARELADSFGIGPRWPEDAITKLRYHTEDHPKDASGWLRLAFAYLFNGRQADAELAIGKAQKIDADHADLAAIRGFIAFREEKTRTARKELQKAIDGSTTYPYRTRLMLAKLARDADDYELAKALLREAIEIHPRGVRPNFGLPNPYHQLAKVLDDEENEEESVAVLEELIKLSRDDFPTRKRLAEYYFAEERWEKLIAAAWDAPFIWPYDQEIHRMLGSAYFETEAYSLAKRELEVQMAAEEPPLREIYPRLAYCYWKLGNSVKARDYAQRAKTMTPDDPLIDEVLKELEGTR